MLNEEYGWEWESIEGVSANCGGEGHMDWRAAGIVKVYGTGGNNSEKGK